MTVYIDSDCKCHLTDDGTMTAIETDFFDGKCADYIEGFRFVPSGKTWTRGDGKVFNGRMFTPWKDFAGLDTAQRSYEQEQLAEYEALINELYSEVTE